MNNDLRRKSCNDCVLMMKWMMMMMAYSALKCLKIAHDFWTEFSFR